MHIYSGQFLRSGLNMGVDSSGHLNEWVQDLNGQMKASYPAGQGWGTIFITVGKVASPGARASMDLSQYSRLSVEMRGEADNQTVFIGLKDNQQPDDGSETTLPVKVSSDWKTYNFNLNDFRGADLTRVYIPLEFVFKGYPAGETITFRNIQVLP